MIRITAAWKFKAGSCLHTIFEVSLSFMGSSLKTSKRTPKSDEIILKLMNNNKKKSTSEVDNSQKAGGLEGRQHKRTWNKACKKHAKDGM